MSSNSNDDPTALEIRKRTFSQVQTFPNFSNLKKTEQGSTEEGNRALNRQLTGRSQKAHNIALLQGAADLSRTYSLTGDPNQFLFDKNLSTGERVKNIKDRRTLLEIAARIRRAGVEIPQAGVEIPKVTFNNAVLSSVIPRVVGADISVASNQEQIDRVNKMDTVERLSSYLAEKLFLIDPSEFSEQNLFDLLNSCNNDTAAIPKRAAIPEPAKYRKSYKTSELVCDPDAPFTEANLRLLQKYDLLKFTLDKTVNKIQQRRNSLSGKAALAVEALTGYIKQIRSGIWIAFMSILSPGSSNGGSKRSRKSKKTSKRRTSKRRSYKRKPSKRRTSKRRRKLFS